MKRRQLAVALLLTLFPLAAAAQDPPRVARKASLAPGVSQAFEHEQRVWNAVIANDIAAFNQLVDGPFTYVDPNGIIAPWTAEHSEGLKRCSTRSFESEDVQAHEPVPGVVILSFKAKVDQSCDGVKSPDTLYVLSVWQRHGNSWKLIAHSETAAAPAQ